MKDFLVVIYITKLFQLLVSTCIWNLMRQDEAFQRDLDRTILFHLLHVNTVLNRRPQFLSENELFWQNFGYYKHVFVELNLFHCCQKNRKGKNEWGWHFRESSTWLMLVLSMSHWNNPKQQYRVFIMLSVIIIPSANYFASIKFNTCLTKNCTWSSVSIKWKRSLSKRGKYL